MTVTGAGEPRATTGPAEAPVVDRSSLDDDFYQSRPPGPASGDNPGYVRWLVEESMLGAAKASAAQFVGQGSMWQNPYAEPN
ncbi:MAG TPA: hypothetical protein VGN48_08865, partial [Pedococcus sp.]|nr:hypothetical protein [Pedococcus sp.]